MTKEDNLRPDESHTRRNESGVTDPGESAAKGLVQSRSQELNEAVTELVRQLASLEEDEIQAKIDEIESIRQGLIGVLSDRLTRREFGNRLWFQDAKTTSAQVEAYLQSIYQGTGLAEKKPNTDTKKGETESKSDIEAPEKPSTSKKEARGRVSQEVKKRVDQAKKLIEKNRNLIKDMGATPVEYIDNFSFIKANQSKLESLQTQLERILTSPYSDQTFEDLIEVVRIRQAGYERRGHIEENALKAIELRTILKDYQEVKDTRRRVENVLFLLEPAKQISQLDRFLRTSDPERLPASSSKLGELVRKYHQAKEQLKILEAYKISDDNETRQKRIAEFIEHTRENILSRYERFIAEYLAKNANRIYSNLATLEGRVSTTWINKKDLDRSERNVDALATDLDSLEATVKNDLKSLSGMDEDLLRVINNLMNTQVWTPLRDQIGVMRQEIDKYRQENKSKKEKKTELEDLKEQIQRTITQLTYFKLDSDRSEDLILRLRNELFPSLERLGTSAEIKRIKEDVEAVIAFMRQVRLVMPAIGVHPAKMDRLENLDNSYADLDTFAKLFSESEFLGNEAYTKAVRMSQEDGTYSWETKEFTKFGDAVRRISRAMLGVQPLAMYEDEAGKIVNLNGGNIDANHFSIPKYLKREDELKDTPDSVLFMAAMFYYYIAMGQSFESPGSDQRISSDFQKAFKLVPYHDKYVQTGRASNLSHLSMLFAEPTTADGTPIVNPDMARLRQKYLEMIVDDDLRRRFSWIVGPMVYLPPARRGVVQSDGTYRRKNRALIPSLLERLKVGEFRDSVTGETRPQSIYEYTFIDPTLPPEHQVDEIYYEDAFQQIGQKGAYAEYLKNLSGDIWGFLQILYQDLGSLVSDMQDDSFYPNFVKLSGYFWPFFGHFENASTEEIKVAQHQFRVSFFTFALRMAILKRMITGDEAKKIINEAKEVLVTPFVGHRSLGKTERFFTDDDVKVMKNIFESQAWEFAQKVLDKIIQSLQHAG